MEVVGDMKNRKFGTHTQAVAGVIEALLMVALVSVVISIIQLIYIPQVMEQKEAEHMDLVSNQFSTLKSMIDLQAITQSTAPISSMITLGSRELPYFITARAYGELRTQEDSTSNINVDYSAFVCPLTSIIYQSQNAYFVDQTYILEGGGIIVKQPTGEPVMRAYPSIQAQITNITNEFFININFSLPIIKGLPGKNSTNGDGKCFIRTNWSQGGTYKDISGSLYSINISTQYPNAWDETLHDMLADNVNYSKGLSYIEITRKDIHHRIYLTIDYYDVCTQIGPGWIK
jgi:competence protein ComGC